MIESTSLTDVVLAQPEEVPSAGNVSFGIPIPKSSRVMTFSDVEWETFTEEWLSSQNYDRVARLGGAGDMGLDVICFTSDRGFLDPWDNYQCKHYDHPLYPSDLFKEISKIIFYTFKEDYSVPRKSYFVAPKGIGTSAHRLLSNATKLKEEARENWVKEISPNTTAELEGDLLEYFENFDFSLFSSVSVADMIAQHATTRFHAVRFGGGLPPRPVPDIPPHEPASVESTYIRQLFRAYGDYTGEEINSSTDLSNIDNDELREDFLRQRERFYHAESLRNFARDTVPDGTFEHLQNEIHSGVVDVCNRDTHSNGFERLRETMIQAANMSTPASALFSVVQIRDRQGICHQLVNGNRLKWVKESEND